MRSRSSVLVLRALGLGDFLTAVPVYRGLRRAFPEHEIVLAAPAGLAPLAGWTGAVDRLLPARELRPVGWRGPPPDLAVNLHGRGPQSHRILAAVPARRRIGFTHPDVPGFEGTAWRPGEHEVRRWCRLMAATGVHCDPTDLLLTPPPVPAGAGTPPEMPGTRNASGTRDTTLGTRGTSGTRGTAGTRGTGGDGALAAGDGRPPVVVHPGATAPVRRWSAERFAAVARELAGQGWPVLITGNTAERPRAREVAELAGLPAGAVLAGRTGDLDALARLVAGAALMVCGDTGVGHLATATGTPSVLLFGPVPPAEWGPLRDRDRHLVLWRGWSGGRHAGTADSGLATIAVPEVLAAAHTLLDRPRQPREPAARPRRPRDPAARPR